MDEKILERFYNRYDRYNTKVLKTLGETVKKFNNVDYMEAVIIAQGLDQAVIVDLLVELEAINALTMKDINEYLDIRTAGRINYHKEHFEYRGTQPDKYIFKEITDKYKRQILSNLPRSNSIGFVTENEYGSKIYRGLGDTYQSLIDKAVNSVALGNEGYQSAMRKVLNGLADSGVKVHEEKLTYPSGRNIRIDSMVKQSILDGYREYQNEIDKEIGKQIGADGVEIDIHLMCAEDHEEIQMRRFSNEQFEQLQTNGEAEDMDGDLVDITRTTKKGKTYFRPIGQLNCGHRANPIISDVDKPLYTKKQVAEINRQNRKQYEYEGKKYTKYEASQEQRRLETAIRRQKDRQIVSKASDDIKGVAKAQKKIGELTSRYNEFSKSMDLPNYRERMSVSGYKRMSVK